MSALTEQKDASQEERAALDQLRSAHDQAMRTPIADVARYVQSLLGQKWTAYLTGVTDPKAVGKWARGMRKPQPESERKLRDAYQIALLIAMVDDEETAGVWFKGMNPVLDHRAPAWVIANLPDGGDRAMNAALAFVAYG
ncbi:MAG TPA: hypothetical protein VFP05_14070 [Thermomicrobiales bacterium]|nr:hypothetical protein [Thermomicrobiales bacterium]